MKQRIYKNLAIASFLFGGILACTPMDDYKKFIGDGEISYTGRVDSVKIYSGEERVMVEGLLISDPKVCGCLIFWNNKMDSLDVPVERTEKVDTLRQIINLPENLYNFELYTYDQFNNRSVPVYKTGHSYGKNFISRLTNRPLDGTPISSEEGLSVKFLPVDKTLGPIYTVISYTNNQDKVDTVHIAIDQESFSIKDYKLGSKFSHYTLYIPDTLCIDTFKTVMQTDVVPMTKISKKNWEITDFDTQEETGEQGGKYGWANQIIDDDITTYWHACHTCNPRPPFPHWISFDMKETNEVTSIELTPRQDGGDPFKDFEILGSMDGTYWTSCGEFTLKNNRSTQRFSFTKPCTMRYVQIYMKNDYSGQPYTYLAEITLFK